MARIVDKSKAVEALQLTLTGQPVHEHEARRWLAETPHREGCQCHRCFWAHGVIAGRIRISFEDWRRR